jgi:hypothetical protein
MEQHVQSSHCLLLEITLHPGAVASHISDFAAVPDESVHDVSNQEEIQQKDNYMLVIS